MPTDPRTAECETKYREAHSLALLRGLTLHERERIAYANGDREALAIITAAELGADLAPWSSSSGRIIFDIRKDDAKACSAPGKPANSEVFALSQKEYMREQFARVIDADIRAELSELGAWSTEELADKFQNRIRLLWVACCDIRESLHAEVQS